MSAVQFLSGERLGRLPYAGAALLAPLSGVTDVAFRRAAARFGAAATVTEMVAADGLAKGEEEARVRSEGTGIHPHVVQLAGRDPAWMAEAARLAEANGADVVDLNMGCPAKKVTGGYAGSALMRDLDLAGRLLDAVRAAVRVPVTVKMRLGWDDASRCAPALARRAEAAGLDGVTVHGRTRQQFYKGRADWAAIAEVVAATSLPVVANGDVIDLDDARACLARSGAAAVMIGRGALGRPWRVGAVCAGLAGRAVALPPAEARLAAAIEHYEALLGLYGRSVGVRHARKHLAAYADAAVEDGAEPLTREQRTRLVTTDDPGTAIGLLRAAFARPLAEAA
jgi:tRNA-dihydrouridine synthase B